MLTRVFGPSQPWADLACVASRSLVKTCGTILWRITRGRKVLPWAVTDRDTCGEGVWRWALKGQPCRGQDTVLSQMGMLRLMQAGCRARLWALHVAHDLLRLGLWNSVCLCEASLPQCDSPRWYWESECSFPRMLFILSKYSPWDHYIFPMIEDYYCSLLVIFLALVPFFLLSYNNVWMSFYLLQSFWCLGSKPICKIPRTMSSQWTHTGL